MRCHVRSLIASLCSNSKVRRRPCERRRLEGESRDRCKLNSVSFKIADGAPMEFPEKTSACRAQFERLRQKCPGPFVRRFGFSRARRKFGLLRPARMAPAAFAHRRNILRDALFVFEMTNQSYCLIPFPNVERSDTTEDIYWPSALLF